MARRRLAATRRARPAWARFAPAACRRPGSCPRRSRGPPYAPDAPALVPAVPPDEFADRMREAGAPRARCCSRCGAAVRPGVTTDELDRICHDACIARGGYPSPLALQGLPEVVVHIGERDHLPRHPRRPRARRRRHRQLRRHDLPQRRARRLQRDVPRRRRRRRRPRPRTRHQGVRCGRASTRCSVGGRINDIGRAIQTHAEAHGFGVVRAFVGHGIGETFHTTPSVPHFYDPHSDTPIVDRA